MGKGGRWKCLLVTIWLYGIAYNIIHYQMTCVNVLSCHIIMTAFIIIRNVLSTDWYFHKGVLVIREFFCVPIPRGNISHEIEYDFVNRKPFNDQKSLVNFRSKFDVKFTVNVLSRAEHVVRRVAYYGMKG